MFSLFMLCPHDVDVQRGQRIMGFFYLNYPQIIGVRKSDHMDKTDPPYTPLSYNHPMNFW